MPIEREIEFKQLLTLKQYHAFLSSFDLHPAQAKRQINYYFDDPDEQLKNHGCALRIRSLPNGHFEMTLKVPANVGLDEHTSPLTKAEAEAFITNPHKIVNLPLKKAIEYLNDIKELKLIAKIITDRIEMNYHNGLLCFDANDFDGIQDYELEYEVQEVERGFKLFESLLKEHQIKFKPAPPKIKRAIEYKKGSK